MKTPKNKDFVVFILSHGRPDKVKTLTTLRNQHYTGDVYIVIDNEDGTAEQYYELFGREKVIMFDKAKAEKSFDMYDNLNISRKTITFARNACYEIARKLGVKYFLELDDDYGLFQYRFSPDLKPKYFPALNLDRLFEVVLEFYKSIPALSIAFGQGGDLLGGDNGGDLSRLWLKRKAMNSFFCCVDRPLTFIGRMDEDVNTYTTLGNRGKLFFTFYNAIVTQSRSQSNLGGSTEMYKESGTYVKSFYPVMGSPSFVKIAAMQSSNPRIHRTVQWANAVPVLISEKHRRLEGQPIIKDQLLFTVDKPKSVAHGLQFQLRLETSDRQVVREVVEQNAYRRRDFQIEQDEKWLDLGANIGSYTLLALRCGASVEAYEPEPDNIQCLKTNLALNGYDCPIHEMAVVADSEKASYLNLYISTEYGKWGHSLYKPKRKQSIRVPTVRISEILQGVDGIKMDIEGAEIPILSTIADFKSVRKLVFEWHFDMSPDVPFFLETIEHLKRFFPVIIHRKFNDTDKPFHRGSIVFCYK